MKVKKMLSLMLLAALVLSLFAVAPVKAEEEIVTEITDKVEIIFWHAMNAKQEESLTKLTEEFMKENENITVTLQNQSSYGDLSQKLITTMQSPDDLPTLTQAYPDWMVPMMAEDMIVDLTPYIECEDEALKFEDYEDIIEGIRDGVTIDEKIVALPFNKSTEVLWYNQTLFEELKLEVPTTFEELAEVSKKIYEEKQIPGCGWDSLTNYYMTYLAGKDVAVDDQLDVTSEESIEAVQYYMDGINEGYFRIAGTDKYMSGPFGSEQVAMYIGSNAGETYVKDGVDGKFEYAAAPYPTGKVIQQGTDVYVFSNATPEQRTAAYLYLRFLTTKENQITWALETGYIPVRTSAVEDKAYSESESAIAPILAEATEELFVTKAQPGSNQARTDIDAFLQELFATPDSDVTEALNEFKADYELIWEEAAEEAEEAK